MEKTEFIPTKECPKCRAKNELSAKFCHDCNSPLEIEITDFLCQYCNTKNDSLSRFCKSCGKKMREDDRDPDIELLETYLGEKFSISRPLGEGGFGRVFLADHKGLGRKEVIKLLGFEQSKNTEIKSRFLQEARILASLNHPHIIPVRDVSEAEGRPYYIMEYKNGGSLQDQLMKKKTLPILEAKEIVLKLLSALTLVHKQGILHRDIKPDNILLSDTGEPVLIDFGIARLEDSRSANKTRTGIAIGTPAYMSPEQWEGKKIDARSDLYSVGILLYELVTGQVPFSSHEVFSKELPRVTSLPEELYLFLQKACAKDPKNRFSTSEEMSTTLMNLIVSTNPKKSKIPHLKEPSESVEPVPGTQKKRSEFILDFLHPFRKELTWKSILLKQLRIFLSISVLPLVVWVGIFELGVQNIEYCDTKDMIREDGNCYYASDKISYENANNICWNQEVKKITSNSSSENSSSLSLKKYPNSSEVDSCIKQLYNGKVKLYMNREYSSYEKLLPYQSKSIKIYRELSDFYLYSNIFLALSYPLYLLIQIIIWIFNNANNRFESKEEKSELDEISVPFKENFSLWLYLQIGMSLFLISLSLKSSAIEIFGSIIFWVGFNGYYIRNQRIHYKKNKLYDIKEQREEQKYREMEKQEKLEKSRTLSYRGGEYNIEIDPEKKEIYYLNNSVASLSNSKRVEEYTIEDKNVKVRCFKYVYESIQWDQKINYILDGIVQESEILKQEEGKHSAFKKTDEELIKYINEFKESTEWNPLKINILKYFILFQHKSEILDLKKYYISERERIRGGFLKYKNFIKKENASLEIKVDNRKYEVFFDWKKSQEEMNKIIANIHSDLKKFNLSYIEFSESRKITLFLYILLKKLDK